MSQGGAPWKIKERGALETDSGDKTGDELPLPTAALVASLEGSLRV